MVVITGAWPAMMPISPSLPGTTTMWTSSLRTSFAGVTSSKCRSAMLLLSLDRGVEGVRRGVELVPAAGIAETHDRALVMRQAVGADRLAGPGTDLVDAL